MLLQHTSPPNSGLAISGTFTRLRSALLNQSIILPACIICKLSARVHNVLRWDTLCRHDLGGTSDVLGPITLHRRTTLHDANPKVTTSATYEEADGPGDDDGVNAIFE